MVFKVKIRKWSDSLGIVIPHLECEMNELSEGDIIEVRFKKLEK